LVASTLVWPCAWLDDSVDATRAAIARWAASRIGVYDTTGPHRSPQIDAWNLAAGAPLGSPWCASFASAVWRANGVTPGGNAACQDWHEKAVVASRWLATPQAGDVALFDFSTTPGWADHCGVVIRVSPTVLTVEGDTDDRGSNLAKGVFMHDRMGAGLLGYVSLGLP